MLLRLVAGMLCQLSGQPRQGVLQINLEVRCPLRREMPNEGGGAIQLVKPPHQRVHPVLLPQEGRTAQVIYTISQRRAVLTSTCCDAPLQPVATCNQRVCHIAGDITVCRGAAERLD